MNSILRSILEIGMLKDSQILVVDNDVDSGVLYTIFLEHFGASVVISKSIKEALEIIVDFIPHLIICEIRFLGESVLQLFKTLNTMELASKNPIPIIVVTSTCRAGVIKEFPDIKFERHLLKPIDLNQLILMVMKLLFVRKNNVWDYELKYQDDNLARNEKYFHDNCLNKIQLITGIKNHLKTREFA
jgi:CheY-like chemotaxis protein